MRAVNQGFRKLEAYATCVIFMAALVGGVLLMGGDASAADWLQWRGPQGQGHSQARNLPVNWDEKSQVSWKQAIPGKGWSSPVIVGDEIWLTTAIDTPTPAAARAERLKLNTGSQPLSVSEKVSLRAVCLDRETGRVKHDIELLQPHQPQWVHSLNSYASPSPIWENGRLYCHFGDYGTACLQTESGKVLWRNRDLRIMHENGPGSTPVLWGDNLIVHCDGSDKQYVAALDKRTGKIAWKTARSGAMQENPQLRKAYGTPLVETVAGRDVVISPGADWLYGYDPSSGRELWKVNYGILGFSIVPRPIVGHGKAYVCTSFLKPQLLAFDLQSARAGQPPKIAWRYDRQVPSMPSPLLVGKEIFFVSDKGIATCLDAITGDKHWSQRLGGNFSSSPMHADGRIYVSNREGETFVLATGPKYKLLAKNKLDGSIMASPAAVDSQIYVRTDKALYRLEKS